MSPDSLSLLPGCNIYGPLSLLYKDVSDDAFDQVQELDAQEHGQKRHACETGQDESHRKRYRPGESTIEEESDYRLAA